jgi:hypothetical protein
MSGDDYSDWDDEDDVAGLTDEELDVSEEEINGALDDMHRAVFEGKVIKTFVSNAYEFGGVNTLIEVLNSIERKMGWRIEFLADRNALDDYAFQEHETFNPDIWEHYANSDSFDQLTYDVTFMSQRNMSEFTDQYFNGPTIKGYLRLKLRAIFWSLYKKF